MIYTIEVGKEGNSWLANVVDLDGVSTWASTFASLDHDVREAIALAENLGEGAENSLELSWVNIDRAHY